MFKNSLQNITCQQVVLISMFFQLIAGYHFFATQIVADEFLSPIWGKSRLFNTMFEFHAALNWVPCLFQHSAATLIKGLGMGNSFNDEQIKQHIS